MDHGQRAYADVNMANVASSSKQPMPVQSTNGMTYKGERRSGNFDAAMPREINGHAQATDTSGRPALSASNALQGSVAAASPSPSSSAAASASILPNGIAAADMPTTAADLMREGPRNFIVLKELGDGSFGTVCLADWKSPLPSGTMLSPMQHPTTRPEYIGKRLVAIKRMKKPFPNWQECMKLKELKSLLAIPKHPNIIPLYDAFLMPTTKELHFVFESMEGNLYQLTKQRRGRPLPGGLVASIFEQIIHGLDHIHSHGYFHRDMKPENLLITTTGLADYPPSSPTALPGTPPERDVIVIVKLADFGLARETDSKPPYTEYVSTRWYRAPEVLLRSRDYSNPVDTWALGTILAELVNLRPLFPGQSEVDQVIHICDVLGDPSPAYGKDERGRVRGGGEWERGVRMARSVGFQFPRVQPRNFHALFNPRVPTSLVDCIQDLLRYDPKLRLTTQDCLKHPYMVRDAPRFRPPQAKPAVSAATSAREPIAGTKVADRLTDEAGRRAIPPSHSDPLSPHHSKPPFGAAGSKLPNVSNLAPLHRVPFYAQPTQAQQAKPAPVNSYSHPSPMQEEPSDIPWASAPGPSHRDSSPSNYPAFPDSASMYAGSHASMQFDGYSRDVPANNGAGPSGSRPSDYRDELSDAQMTDATLRPNSRGAQLRAHQYKQYQQQQNGTADVGSSGGANGRTVYDDDLSLAYSQERSARRLQQQQAQLHLHPSSSHPQPTLADGGSHAMGMAGSSSELSQKNDSNASNETIGSREKERRRSKGWGLHIFSSNSPQAGTSSKNVNGVANNSGELRQPSQQFYGQSAQTPAQKLAAEHSAAAPTTISPSASTAQLDPKKAKKEAERAAKEAEKARREAQQKAARDRARAVIQKRNQLLASSNSKEAVEWLSGTVQTDDSYRIVPPSDKARGKQPAAAVSQLSPSMPTFPSSEFPRSPHYPSQQLSQPTSPSFGSRVTSPSASSNMAWRGVGGLPQHSRSSKARRREYDDDHSMSSFEDALDPRRISVQSYQTGDSDPGPLNRTQLPPHSRMQRANSSSSLASAPSVVDPRRFGATSMESQRSSQETRSISSLDHQLITNMENMTAAEARARTPGNVSPGPVHLMGARQSVSRQSRANSRASSASAHRAGSASPLHHAAGIPRFHPYSHGPGTSQSSSSYHQGYQLPPLHQTLPPNGSQPQPQPPPPQRDARPTGDALRTTLGSAEGTQLPPLASLQQQVQPSYAHVNPIFQVRSAGVEGGASTAPATTTTKLPPFSHFAAAADVHNGLRPGPEADRLYYGSQHA